MSQQRAAHSERAIVPAEPDETTTLLGQGNGRLRGDARERNVPAGELTGTPSQDHGELQNSIRLARLPSLVALILLSIAIIVILVVAFILPQIVEQYAMQAVKVEPTGLKIITIASWGVLAHVTANFEMDANRVPRKLVRGIGRFGTWIAKEVETGETMVTVSIPEYGDAQIGSALVPPLKVNVRHGHITPLEFTTTLKPGSQSIVGSIANDWLAGRFNSLGIHGTADVPIKSGILSLGTQSISQNIKIQSNDLPAMPSYNLSHAQFHEIPLPDGSSALTAEVSLEIANRYPFEFTLPPLDFDILVPNCAARDNPIGIADTTTPSIYVKPYEDVSFKVSGIIRGMPETLVRPCPKSHQSPLDGILGNYIHGSPNTVYIRGSHSPMSDTPQWITDIISEVTVPVPFPGQDLGRLIRRFSLEHVQFVLPDSDAEPDTPDAQPKVSAEIKALVALPKEMNFPVEIHRVRADADVFFRGKKLGFLDLKDWQDAKSAPTGPLDGGQSGLEVSSVIEKAPLRIEDDAVFADVIQALLKTRQTLNLTVEALVDVEMKTTLGQFVVRKIPGEGIVPIKPLGGGSLESFKPEIYDLEISKTDTRSLTLELMMNFINPTEYSATVPYMDIHLLVNDTILGHATARNIRVVPGKNTGIPIQGIWQPSVLGGNHGVAIGRELLSQYISGYNTSLTIKPHSGSFPSQPKLGRALEWLEIELPTPRLGSPSKPPKDGDGDEDDGAPHFIKDATMHLLTSSAVFTLVSPLQRSTLYITHLNATAFHEGEAVGRIVYDGSLAVPPGESTTPRLPVQWSLDSLGYQDVKQALGGSLKLAAKAEIGLLIGQYNEKLWFSGQGIGAKVRL